MLTLLAFGLLEVGCIYTTLLVYLMMTIAFYEMICVQRNEEKETVIQIKTVWVEMWFYAAAQFYLVSKTWLTQDLLTKSHIFLPSLLDDMLFKFHSFYTFCFLAGGMILFVLSLEEGFYAYQFKQLGWTLLNLLFICTAGHGHLIGLWRLRLWFVYTVVLLSLRDSVDRVVSRFVPSPPLHPLSPKATVLGYLTGIIAVFAFYFNVSEKLTLLGVPPDDRTLLVQRKPPHVVNDALRQ